MDGYIRGKAAEPVEKKVAIDDQMKRIGLTAPLDAGVHQSTVHTVGEAILPGEVVMPVVPERDPLTAQERRLRCSFGMSEKCARSGLRGYEDSEPRFRLNRGRGSRPSRCLEFADGCARG